MKLVLDTDVLVSAFRSPSGASRLWLRDILRGREMLLLTVPLVLQYEDVLTRPEHLAHFGVGAEDVGLVLDALCQRAETLAVSYLWRPMLRDPDDEMVLEAAVQGQADVLLTFNTRDFAGAVTLGMTIMRPGPAWRRWKGDAQ